MSHTPAPWEASAKLSGSENDKGWYLRGGHPSRQRWIADVSPVCEEDGNASEEGKANLSLIEAAPDLLAALRMLLAEHDAYELDRHGKERSRIAREAIAKAEGK